MSALARMIARRGEWRASAEKRKELKVKYDGVDIAEISDEEIEEQHGEAESDSQAFATQVAQQQSTQQEPPGTPSTREIRQAEKMIAEYAAIVATLPSDIRALARSMKPLSGGRLSIEADAFAMA